MLNQILKKREKFEYEINKIGNYILENKKKIRIINKKKFQTNLDVITDKKIKKLIFDFFNTRKVISEENKSNKLPKKNYWLIDPIDGTRSLYDGYKSYGIQLCYVLNNKPVYSLINLPSMKKNISAIINNGVKINGKKLKIKNSAKKIIVDNYPKPNFECKRVMEACKINKYIEAGSFAYKSMLIALNKASLFFKNVEFYAWDVFPQTLINKELGNFTFDLKGNEFVAIKKLSYRNGLIISKSKNNIKKIVQLYK
ncbi:inositol monophosphatase family protein [Candidatus Pelagibacter sp.]|uniref:inositol monophosphatase family protein n=1 Tax=Candidatus Pelagibacter sp. TaxID=2024849 RepID=UPI003F873E75|tara:strand:- start:106 stop:870 length:765 start_codon:yes stop_codon:yes gene_type:complete